MTQVTSSKLSYRAEIDGLRAIAVISVILYHAQMVLFGRDWFEGGYIGVDIFFVISGYLITRIIFSELYEKGSFNFLNFYERRARRILPMLFLVIFVSIPFAWQRLLPSDLVEYAESILASVFFGSNFFFYFSTTEYGADSALLKPFLHTWSLGVEEQFYLVFPILAIVAFKFFRKHFLTILVALSLLSLQFAELMEVRNSGLNFYLPFSRVWELAVGSMLAYRELNYTAQRDSIVTKILPTLGLYLVGYSVFFFDSKTPHPSFHTTIPILGVALIIGYASKEELVGKVLGSKPFVGIGLISYSAYLWHFPIFAFSRYGSKEASNYDKSEWIALTLILSVVSYFVIEKLFRNKAFITRARLAVLLATSVLMSLIATTLVLKNEGYEARFPIYDALNNYQIDNKKLKIESWNLLHQRQKAHPNFFDVPNKVLIVGNSHAKDIFNALHQNKNSFVGYDFLRLEANANFQISCFNESVGDYKERRDDFYNSEQYKSSSILLVSTYWLLKNNCDARREDWSISSDLEGVKGLVKRAKGDGKRIVILGLTPIFKKIENKWVADYVVNNASTAMREGINLSFEELELEADKTQFTLLEEKKLNEINERVKSVALDLSIPFYDKTPIVCRASEKECDVFTSDGFKAFYDGTHYTLKGAKFFGERLAKDEMFRQLLGE